MILIGTIVQAAEFTVRLNQANAKGLHGKARKKIQVGLQTSWWQNPVSVVAKFMLTFK